MMSSARAKHLVISTTSSTLLHPVEAFEKTLKKCFEKMLPHLGAKPMSHQGKLMALLIRKLYTQSRAFAAPACQGTRQGHAVGSIWLQ